MSELIKKIEEFEQDENMLEIAKEVSLASVFLLSTIMTQTGETRKILIGFIILLLFMRFVMKLQLKRIYKKRG